MEQIRSLNAKLNKLTFEAAKRGPIPVPGEVKRRYRRTLTQIREEIKVVTDKLVRVHAQVKPEQPEDGGDGTANLLDKVGESGKSGANPY